MDGGSGAGPIAAGLARTTCQCRDDLKIDTVAAWGSDLSSSTVSDVSDVPYVSGTTSPSQAIDAFNTFLFAPQWWSDERM